MKKSNFWKLLSGTVFFATVALASCVDDNDDKGMPYLEVTPDVLTFNADGAPADIRPRARNRARMRGVSTNSSSSCAMLRS